MMIIYHNKVCFPALFLECIQRDPHRRPLLWKTLRPKKSTVTYKSLIKCLETDESVGQKLIPVRCSVLPEAGNEYITVRIHQMIGAESGKWLLRSE